ncbi:MAG: hypothetical protein IPG63_03505 [Xanthomonadales bacterium]|nr:hypothetical protein [Xanthomonadales bacterium]MBK7144031.1 hypothetical protein [Xanthomonadales bacterium]MCC6560623.1 hypothetical protein [Xanthomonadales bacterium]
MAKATLTTAHLERVIADKAKQRLAARAKSWPEKIATIERLRNATRIARAGMAAKRKAEATPPR